MSDLVSVEISDMPNLGPRSAEMLAAAGIHSRNQLEQLGPVAAYLAAQQVDGSVSLNLLWSIVTALDGVHWTDLSAERKSKLRAELDELTGSAS